MAVLADPRGHFVGLDANLLRALSHHAELSWQGVVL